MSDLTASAGAIPISMGLHDLPKRTPKPTHNYPHASWRHQLRDRLGQWIEMGTGVKWLAGGAAKQGHIVGSNAPGSAIIEETNTGRRVKVPTNRLTAFMESPTGTWVHAKPDDPTELTIRSIKSQRLVLDTPTRLAPAPALQVAEPIVVRRHPMWPDYTAPREAVAREGLAKVAEVTGDSAVADAFAKFNAGQAVEAHRELTPVIEKMKRRKKDRASARILKDLMRVDQALRDIILAQWSTSPLGMTAAIGQQMEARIIQRELLTG